MLNRNLLTILLVFGGIAACIAFGYFQLNRSATIRIHVIIPVGFQGMATVTFSPSNGDHVAPENGVYTYRIPPSGVLHVRGENPEYLSHVVTARYEDGVFLPVGYLSDGSSFGEGVIAVWPLLLERDDAGFFVGTKDELATLVRKEQERMGIRLPHTAATKTTLPVQ